MIEKFAVIGTPSLEALLLHAEPGTHLRRGARQAGRVHSRIRSSYFDRREVRIRSTVSAALRRAALRVTIAVSAEVTTTDAYSNATRVGMANAETRVASRPSIEHLIATPFGWLSPEGRSGRFPAMLAQRHGREIRANGEGQVFRPVSGPEAT
jgi:hypothetical protein